MPQADTDTAYNASKVEDGIIKVESDKRLNMFARPKPRNSVCSNKCGECSLKNGGDEMCVNVKRYNQHLKDANSGPGADVAYVAVLRKDLGKKAQVFSLNKLATSFPGLEKAPNAKSNIISVRCCKDGVDNGAVRPAGAAPVKATCLSKDDAKQKCYPKAATFAEAEAVCKADGRRLCTFSEGEACDGTGCGYNKHYSWISKAPVGLNATVATPIISDVNVMANVTQPSLFLDEPTKDDDQCRMMSAPVLQVRKATRDAEARSTGKDVVGQEVNGALSQACEWFKAKPFIATPSIDCTCGMIETRGCEEKGGHEFTKCAIPKKMDPVTCPPTSARATGSAFDVCTECNKKGICQFKTRHDNCGVNGCTGCRWVKKSAKFANEANCEQCPILISNDVSATYGYPGSTMINKDGRPAALGSCKKDCQECRMPANEVEGCKQEARCVNVWRYNHNNPTRFMDTKITMDNQECALSVPTAAGGTIILGRRRGHGGVNPPLRNCPEDPAGIQTATVA